MLKYTNDNGAATHLPATPRAIHGRSLSHRDLNKQQRAIVAARMSNGTVPFIPTTGQAALICGVSTTYAVAAKKLSLGEQAAIMAGYSVMRFAELLKPKPQELSLVGPVIPVMKISDATEITNAQLEDLARIIGPDRMLNAAVAAELA